MEEHTALAAIMLSGCLFAAAWIAPAPAPPPCEDPVEVAAVDRHTTRVRCGAGAGESDRLRGPARRLFGHGVDLNCSDAATLETLPGIGPARAEAIVAERERRPFEHADALVRVAGIGPKTLERLRSQLTPIPGPADPASVDSPSCRSTGEPREPQTGERGRLSEERL